MTDQLSRPQKYALAIMLAAIGAGLMWLAFYWWHDAQVFFLGGWCCQMCAWFDEIRKGRL